MVLPPVPAQPSEQSTSEADQSGASTHQGVAESWTSDFNAGSVAESEDPSLVGSSMVQGHGDDTVRGPSLTLSGD